MILTSESEDPGVQRSVNRHGMSTLGQKMKARPYFEL